MGLANWLTIVRILFVPVLVTLLVYNRTGWALLAFVVAGVTDTMDGYIARTRGTKTRLGAFLDPLADKLLILFALMPLVQLQLVPAWMAAIIIGREFAITGLRSIASAQGFTIEASQFGKIKMVTQVAAITFLILGMPGDSPNPTFQKLGNFMLYVVVVFAVVSAVDYFRRFWTKIDDRFKAKQRRRLILLEKRQRRQVTARHAPTRDVPTH